MLMRGNIEERVQFAFQIYDKGEKGHLTVEEFEEFLKSIIQVVMLTNKGSIDPYFNEDLEQFEKAMLALCENKEMISFLELKNELLGHDFIKSCDETEVTRKRGETIAKITSSFSLIQKGSNRSSVQPQIPSAIEEANEDEDDEKGELEQSVPGRQSNNTLQNPVIHEEEEEKCPSTLDNKSQTKSTSAAGNLEDSAKFSENSQNMSMEKSEKIGDKAEVSAETIQEKKPTQIRYRETDQDFEEGNDIGQDNREFYGRIETWDKNGAISGVRRVNMEKSGHPGSPQKGEACQMCNIF